MKSVSNWARTTGLSCRDHPQVRDAPHHERDDWENRSIARTQQAGISTYCDAITIAKTLGVGEKILFFRTCERDQEDLDFYALKFPAAPVTSPVRRLLNTIPMQLYRIK